MAIIAAVWYRAVAAPVAWLGFAVSLGGVGLVTVGGGGGGATMAGDGLVLVSLLLSATVTVAQGRLLTGRDPVAVTAVQFLGATVGALPIAVLTEGTPAAPAGAGAVLAVAALAVGGTLAPFTLFAFGQSRVSAEVAGGFLNLEPLVGAIAGAVAFGDPVGLVQVAGGLAILGGIGLSSLPLIAGRRAEARSRGPAAGSGGWPRLWSAARARLLRSRPGFGFGSRDYRAWRGHVRGEMAGAPGAGTRGGSREQVRCGHAGAPGGDGTRAGPSGQPAWRAGRGPASPAGEDRAGAGAGQGADAGSAGGRLPRPRAFTTCR